MKGYLNLNLKPMRKGICQGGVVVILGDCGSLDPGSNLGPGLFFILVLMEIPVSEKIVNRM